MRFFIACVFQRRYNISNMHELRKEETPLENGNSEFSTANLASASPATEAELEADGAKIGKLLRGKTFPAGHPALDFFSNPPIHKKSEKEAHDVLISQEEDKGNTEDEPRKVPLNRISPSVTSFHDLDNFDVHDFSGFKQPTDINLSEIDSRLESLGSPIVKSTTEKVAEENEQETISQIPNQHIKPPLTEESLEYSDDLKNLGINSAKFPQKKEEDILGDLEGAFYGDIPRHEKLAKHLLRKFNTTHRGIFNRLRWYLEDEKSIDEVYKIIEDASDEITPKEKDELFSFLSPRSEKKDVLIEDNLVLRDDTSFQDIGEFNLNKQEPASLDENLSLKDSESQDVPMGETRKSFGPMTKEETESFDEVDSKLKEARDEYTKLYIDWETKEREKRRFLSKTLLDLGINRPRLSSDPTSLKTSAIEDAKEEYIKMRAAKMSSVYENDKLFEYRVSERESLDKGMNDLRSFREKNIIIKAAEKFSKIPPKARLLLPATLMIGGFATGFIPAAGLVGYAGYRAVGLAGGMLGAKGAGKLTDLMQRGGNEKRENIARENFAALDSETAEEKERKELEFTEKEADIKNRQQKIKVGAMIAGGLAGAGAASSTFHALNPDVQTDLGIMKSFKKMFGFGGSPVEASLPKDVTPHDIAPSREMENLPSRPNIPETVMPPTVELSPKGFLQDIHNLKAKILVDYNGKTIPDSIKTNILDKSSLDLAKELGVYDPAQHIDVRGLQGEHLTINSDGKIYYDHLNAVKDIPAPLSPLVPQTPDAYIPPEVSNVSSPMEISEETMIPPAPPIEDTLQSIGTHEIPAIQPLESTHIPYNNSFIDVVDNGIAKAVKWNNMEIAHEHSFGNGKILYLEHQFQEGPYGEIKKAFNLAFDQNIRLGAFAENSQSIPFEGGRIHVLQGLPENPNGIKILLNGREIASGALDGGISKVKILNVPEIKGAWWTQTPYERALNAAVKAFKFKKL